MVGRQGLAHLRTDTHRNGRKVNVSSDFAIGCASVHPQCCREFPCVMKHDDRDVSIGGHCDVVGVSNIISVILYVVRPSFPMMTITSSMMMMMSCLVDPVGAEVANQSNSGLQHSSTLGAWVCRAG